MRGTCPNCGVTVDMARGATTGEVIPLDIAADASSDAPRYRVVRIEDQHAVVELVKSDATGTFQPDHRFDCPAFNAGRR